MNDRKRLKMEGKENTKSNVNSINIIEQNIANFLSEKNRNRILKCFQDIANSENSCNTRGMWKQIRKVVPKILKTIPTVIKNNKCKIITNTSSVKQIIVRKYKQRLGKRPANPQIKELMKIKEENALRIIELARKEKLHHGQRRSVIKCV